MATTKRRKNSITKFLQDVIDDSKELVDDMIDRASDVEENARDAVKDVVDDEDDSDSPSSDELAELEGRPGRSHQQGREARHRPVEQKVATARERLAAAEC